MPETAADHPAPASTQHDTKTTLKHLAWGAIPATAAFIAILWQILNPYVSHNHQGLLMGVAVYLGNITLAVWLWCTVQVVRKQFAERDRLADARVARLQQEVYVIEETLAERHVALLSAVEKLCRSVRGLHAHNSHSDEQLQQVDEQMQQIVKEAEHTRKLILGIDEAPSLPSQQLGPRRLN